MLAKASAWVLTLALAGAGAFAGLQTLRLANEQRAHADTQAGHARKLLTMSEAAIRDEQEARAEEQRRVAALQEITNAAKNETTQARADAVAATDVGRKLQQRVAALTADLRQARSQATTSGGSAPAGDPIGVLADVLGRCDRRAGILAEYADAASTAGRACERAYDALTPGSGPN